MLMTIAMKYHLCITCISKIENEIFYIPGNTIHFHHCRIAN